MWAILRQDPVMTWFELPFGLLALSRLLMLSVDPATVTAPRPCPGNPVRQCFYYFWSKGGSGFLPYCHFSLFWGRDTFLWQLVEPCTRTASRGICVLMTATLTPLDPGSSHSSVRGDQKCVCLCPTYTRASCSLCTPLLCCWFSLCELL